MFGPFSAMQVRAARRNGIAGVCKSRISSYPEYGWFVPYQKMPGYIDGCQAVITLLVQDLSGSYADNLSFVIDTGTNVTIIPRKLIEPRAFPRSRMNVPCEVEGVTGKVVTGYRYLAAFAIPKLLSDPASLSFGMLKPIIVDHWESDYGMLGLDALRQVVMVSDQDHICFWPSPMAIQRRKRFDEK
jgi:hypothetical protein